MKYFSAFCLVFTAFLVISYVDDSTAVVNMFDLRYWRCFLKKSYICPDNDIKFYLYNHETGLKRKRIDIRNNLALKYSGWDPDKNNVIIIHGFNGTESKTPMTILRDAYLSRDDYNIFMVDWKPLTQFPCYLSSVSNTQLVAKCTAQFYAYVMDLGGSAEKTTCIGHSLGAHICGMMSNHLDIKQHRIVGTLVDEFTKVPTKIKIFIIGGEDSEIGESGAVERRGLDPARPLVSQFGSRQFRLTTEDAHQVQVVHTNSGFLGETNQIGHVDFCVNGGRLQPGCKGHKLRKARCSHFQSVCFFAGTVRNGNSMIGRPCSGKCPKEGSNWGYLPGKPIPMGNDCPVRAKGTYCVRTSGEDDCPFN